MHALLLTLLTLGFNEGSTHAKLHPADAGIFIEVPDAALVCGLYDQAPLLRLLNDGEIQNLFKALGTEGDDTTVSTTQLTKWIGEAIELELPAEDLQGGLSSMSLSMRYANEAWGMTAILDTKSEELAAQLHAKFKELADTAEPHAVEGFETLSGAGFPVPLWFTRNGKQLALGFSDETALGLSERLQGTGSSLADSQALQQGLATLGPVEGTPILLGCTTGALPMAELLPGGPIGAAIAKKLSVPFTLRTSFHKQRFVTGMFGATGKNTDKDVMGGANLEEGWLSDLPDDAMLTYATTIDGSQIGAVLEAFIKGTPELSGFTSLGGVDLDEALKSLIDGLGPRLLVSMQPVMGLGLPPTYIWVDAKDPAAFVKNFESMAAAIGAKIPGIGARTRDYRVKNKVTGERISIPYTTLTVPPEYVGNLGMFAPKLTFAQLEGQLLFSLSSTALKTELKRIYNGMEPEPRDFLGKSGIELHEGTRSLIVFDWGRLFSKLIGLAKLMGPLAGDMVPFDLALLPSPAVFGRYLKPTVHVARQTEAGMVREHRSSFGLLTWGAGMGVLGFRAVGPQMMAPAMAPPVQAPDAVFHEERPNAPEKDASVDSTRAALRDLKSGLAIYKLESGSLPATLNVLVVATDDYPKGFLAEADLPQDGWGHTFRYVKEASGYRLWSVGPNGRDESGDGDDVVP